MNRGLRALVVTAMVAALSSACGSSPSRVAGAASQPSAPTATSTVASTSASPSGGVASSSRTASPSPSPGPTSPGTGLARCETFAHQTYVNPDYGFSTSCPSGFSWQTFAGQSGSWPFASRIVDDKYLNGYPPGQIEFEVRQLDSDTLRHWIAGHTGDPMAAPDQYFWNSTSNVSDVTIGGVPGIAYDFVMKGPESPVNFHAAALILKSKYVLLIDWWAYSTSGDESTIDSVAASVVASITIS
jgi:hypothetical protein